MAFTAGRWLVDLRGVSLKAGSQIYHPAPYPILDQDCLFVSCWWHFVWITLIVLLFFFLPCCPCSDSHVCVSVVMFNWPNQTAQCHMVYIWLLMYDLPFDPVQRFTEAEWWRKYLTKLSQPQSLDFSQINPVFKVVIPITWNTDENSPYSLRVHSIKAQPNWQKLH